MEILIGIVVIILIIIIVKSISTHIRLTNIDRENAVKYNDEKLLEISKKISFSDIEKEELKPEIFNGSKETFNQIFSVNYTFLSGYQNSGEIIAFKKFSKLFVYNYTEFIVKYGDPSHRRVLIHLIEYLQTDGCI